MNLHHHIVRITENADPESAVADFIKAVGAELNSAGADPTPAAAAIAASLAAQFTMPAIVASIAAAVAIDRSARQTKRNTEAAAAGTRARHQREIDLLGYDPRALDAKAG